MEIEDGVRVKANSKQGLELGMQELRIAKS